MKISSATSVGKIRSVNEDSFCVSQIGENGEILAVVADGMGGHNAGEVASAQAVKVLKDLKLRADVTIKDTLLCAIDCANNEIYKMSQKQPEQHGMGTTITACVIAENTATVAQVGDSRLYLIRDGKLSQITKDHSLVEMLLESGEITEADAKHHPQKNVITRALGTDNTVEADTYELEISDGDIILLCSDGLVNMVDDKKILSIITNNQDFGSLAESLVTEAENTGGIDNITVVLVKF